MVQGCVVIISDQSLFIEGVTSRLRQYLKQVTLKIVDPRQPDVMTQIIAAQPSTVLIDGTNSKMDKLCSMNKLLFSLPLLKIIHLDLQQEHIQVVTSEQYLVDKMCDLAGMIEQSAGNCA